MARYLVWQIQKEQEVLYQAADVSHKSAEVSLASAILISTEVASKTIGTQVSAKRCLSLPIVFSLFATVFQKTH